MEYGENGTEVEAIPEKNYEFVGWSDGTNTAKRTDTNVMANITVEATFAIKKYQVTFVIGHDQLDQPFTVSHGDTLQALPIISVVMGYGFNGWYYDDGTFAFPFDINAPIVGDLVVYADWLDYQAMLDEEAAKLVSHMVGGAEDLQRSPTVTKELWQKGSVHEQIEIEWSAVDTPSGNAAAQVANEGLSLSFPSSNETYTSSITVELQIGDPGNNVTKQVKFKIETRRYSGGFFGLGTRFGWSIEEVAMP